MLNQTAHCKSKGARIASRREGSLTVLGFGFDACSDVRAAGIVIVVGLTILVGSAKAQSSRDYWDSKFHPRELQTRIDQQEQDWLKSWANRECTLADVKQRWLMVLTKMVPDKMDASYSEIVRYNFDLLQALQSTVYDFDAQDVADKVNIARLLRAGKVAQANALEQLRLQRIRNHQQEQYQREMIARQKAIQRKVAELEQEVISLQVAANQAVTIARQVRLDAGR